MFDLRVNPSSFQDIAVGIVSHYASAVSEVLKSVYTASSLASRLGTDETNSRLQQMGLNNPDGHQLAHNRS